MATANKSVYRRASEYDTFGKSLDALLDRDVILRYYSVQERSLRDHDTKEKGDRTFVIIKVNELNDEDGTPLMYHAWSEDLADKLSQIPHDDLPLIIKFMRVQTASGFKVFTFE